MLAILEDLKIKKSESVYVGDDLIDLPAMNEAGIAVTVANAQPLVKSRADWVTENQGGEALYEKYVNLSPKLKVNSIRSTMNIRRTDFWARPLRS